MGKYPDCFPDNFEEKILPKDAKFENKRVYRVIKNGIINKDSFISTFEEEQRGLRPRSKKGLDLLDPGYYSTSCQMEYSDADYLLNIFMRHNPKVFIAEGVTEMTCGPCQLTSERDKRNDSHVDWWIYKEAEPQKYFKEVEKHDE